jgi:hypothetical protein
VLVQHHLGGELPAEEDGEHARRVFLRLLGHHIVARDDDEFLDEFGDAVDDDDGVEVGRVLPVDVVPGRRERGGGTECSKVFEGVRRC